MIEINEKMFKFPHLVYTDESTWYFTEEGLTIELCKVDDKKWWKIPFEGVIPDKTMDKPPPRSLYEYDDEKISEMRKTAYIASTQYKTN